MFKAQYQQFEKIGRQYAVAYWNGDGVPTLVSLGLDSDAAAEKEVQRLEACQREIDAAILGIAKTNKDVFALDAKSTGKEHWRHPHDRRQWVSALATQHGIAGSIYADAFNRSYDFSVASLAEMHQTFTRVAAEWRGKSTIG